MYILYYKVLKVNYYEDVNFVYMDTESLALDIKNVDVHNEIQNSALKEQMDLSNLQTKNLLYGEENKGKPGLLKSETSTNLIGEIISLASNCHRVF